MKIRTKIILLLLALSIIPLVVSSYFNYRKTKSALIGETLSHVESVSQTQKNRLDGKIAQNIERIKSITNKSELKECLELFQKTGRASYQKRMNEILADTRPPLTNFQQVDVVNLQGIIVASTEPSVIGQSYSQKKFFKTGLKDFNVNEFFLYDNRLFLWLAGPMIRNEKIVGVAVIAVNAENIITAINDYTGLGKTGETVLAMKDQNGDALFITNVRKDNAAALRRVVPKESGTPINLALEGVERVVTDHVDYKGDPVFASTRYLSQTGWGIVSKVDRDEALRSLETIRRLKVMIIGFVIIVVFIAGLIFSRFITRPIDELKLAALNVLTDNTYQKVSIKSTDEIGTLSEAFNKMTSNLLAINESLTQQTKTLEEQKEKLEESEARFRLMNELQPELVWTATADGKLNFLNQRVTVVLGLPAEEVRGDGWFNRVHPDDRQRSERIWRHSIQTGRDFFNEFRLKTASGDYRWFMARAIPVRDRFGKVQAWFGISSDIHAQKELLEIKDELTSFVTHELRAPLTSLKGYIQLLRRCVERNEPCDLLDYIVKADELINKTNRLVTELHEVSKVTAGKIQISKTRFNFKFLLSEVVESVSTATPSHKVFVSGNTDLIVSADRNRIEQVLTNYLSNAIKYSPGKDKVEVQVSIVDGYLKVGVRDYGIGIPEDMQYKVFERFFRADNVTRIEGLGLGLFISKEIILAHKGKVWVESKEGDGSTFYFCIPIEENLKIES